MTGVKMEHCSQGVTHGHSFLAIVPKRRLRAILHPTKPPDIKRQTSIWTTTPSQSGSSGIGQDLPSNILSNTLRQLLLVQRRSRARVLLLRVRVR